MVQPNELSKQPPSASVGRYPALAVAFLGWLFAGVQLGVTAIAMRDSVKDLLGPASEGDYGTWFGWLTASFMFGAATGGYVLGWVGDRWGRKRAIILSIASYSLFSGLTYFVQSADQMLWMRFLVGLGVGGMWPNGISLVTEAWPSVSRPMVAGIIGTSANIGTMLFALLACWLVITPDSWRWVMLLGLAPILLAGWAMIALPESPQWLALQRASSEPSEAKRTTEEDSKWAGLMSLLDIFRPPILRITLVGMLLGTIPLFGGWGSSNWANAWASEVGGSSKSDDPALKARALLARSAPGSVASLLGGLLAFRMGRRACYCLLALGCLVCSQCLFRLSHPSSASFIWWTAALGVFNGFFFGWLPLCLPELFPTRVRATGAGVSFNFGRIATAVGILAVASMLKATFGGDYAAIGQFTSWVYLIGAIVIWFAPDTSCSTLSSPQAVPR